MASVHPQVAALLERVKASPLPPYFEVPPHVARRIYRDTRAAVSPPAPEVAEARLAICPGPGGPIALRVYRAARADAKAPLPVLVYFHGGGWVIGDLDTHDVVCRELANGAQCSVVSVDYRLAPEHRFPGAVEDCIAATRWVAANAATLAIDPARIAVGGDSAGGNLAAVVALEARDNKGPKLVHQLLVYPATDQRLGHPSIDRNGEGYMLTKKGMQYFRGHYLPNEADWTNWRASPSFAKTLAGLPPALVITAGFDPLVDEGREWAGRLAKDGVETAYHDYPDMIHGFLLYGRVLDTANAAVKTCAEALRKAFGGAR
ncbi:MAG TPA: alpha/beta hydrolase [Burkholderiales bacterium]